MFRQSDDLKTLKQKIIDIHKENKQLSMENTQMVAEMKTLEKKRKEIKALNSKVTNFKVLLYINS
jgi:cell division protein FtsB